MLHHGTQQHIERNDAEMQRGFTLVETLVAIGLLFVMLAGPFTLLHKTLQASGYAKNQTTAYYLAQDAEEYIKNFRDSAITADTTHWNDFLSLCQGTTCTIDTSKASPANVDDIVDVCSGACPTLLYDSANRIYGHTTGAPSEYRRTVTVTEIVPGQEHRIDVSVQWLIGLLPRSVVIRYHAFSLMNAQTPFDPDEPPPTSSTDPPTSGLVAYWPFDTNANDISSSNFHGVFSNGAVLTTVAKVGGGAVALDGVNDRVTLASGPLPDPTSAWTFSAWINWASGTAGDQVLYAAGSSNNAHWQAVLRGNRLQIDRDGTCGASQFVQSASAIPRDTWIHVAISKASNDTATIYIDGVADQTGPFACDREVGTRGIGYRTEGNDQYFSGTIDEVRIYNRALTADEVVALYAWGGDNTAPSPVTNLVATSPTASTMVLSWTATGDDGDSGNAVFYDMRRSTSPIADENFDSATPVSGEPSANVTPGTTRQMTVSGLSAGTTYYFAIKTGDDAGNMSGISNVAFGTTDDGNDTAAPAAITSPTITNIQPTQVTLNWTAPGDDGLVGAASSYEVRYRLGSTFTSAHWDVDDFTVVGEPIPALSGTNQSMVISGLQPDTQYAFAIKASDEIPNIGLISTGNPSATTGTIITIPTTGLVAEYLLNESSGTNAPDTGTVTPAAAGTLSGSPLPAWTTGFNGFGNALDFNGTSAYVDLGNPAKLQLAGALSISTWVWIDTFTSSGRIISKSGGSSQRGWELNVESSNVARFSIASNGSTGIAVSSPSAPPSGQWVHLVGVYEPSTALRLYVNNSLVATNATGIPASQYNATNNVNIGRRANNCCYFDGRIDQVRVYNRVLSVGEIDSLYNEGSAPTSDTTPPAAIASPTVTGVQSTQVTLNWTAPGDDGSSGTASSYDIRYRAGSSFSESDWASATTVIGEPAPQAAGTNQSMAITGLTPGTQYTFAIKTSDEVPNNSIISTSNPTVTTQGGGGSQIFNSSGSWTAPSGVTSVTVEVWGGGGGGGTLTSSFVGGGGGGGGAYSRKTVSVTPGNNYSVTVGAGGAGGAAVYGASGVAGGDSWFVNSSTVMAKGGGGANGSTSAGGVGGSSGAGIGDTKFGGGNGSSGSGSSTGGGGGAAGETGSGGNGTSGTPGSGGSGNGSGGNGGNGGTENVAGSNGVAPGGAGGAGGATSGGAALAAGAGAGGRVVIVWSGGGSDTTAPATIASPTVTNVQSDRVTLNWTAPGDDGSSGTAASYDIRYRIGATFVEADWAGATEVVGEPSPQVAGTNQSMTITGLSASTQYTFAIKTSDEAPNISAISTGNPTATTLAGGGGAGSGPTDFAAFWPFDTNANDVNSIYHGTLTNGASIVSSAKIGAGSVRLDGIDDYVRMGDVLDMRTGDLTYSLWARTVAPTTVALTMMSKTSTTNEDPGYLLEFTNNDDVNAQIGNGTAHISINLTNQTTALRNGEWHHYAVVYDRVGLMRLYVDGTQVDSASIAAFSGNDIDAAQSFVIGAQNGGSSQLFAGDIDHVKIYSRALSASEITSLFNEGSGSGSDTTAPGTIASPTISNVQTDRVTLSWTAPGDDGSSGTAASYEIKYRVGSTFVEGDWATATAVAGEPTPASPGTGQSMTISGLSPGTQFTFAIKTSDEAANVSAISTGNPTATTLPGIGGGPSDFAAFWPFDTNANDFNGTYNGALLNGASIVAEPKIGAGALRLDGVNDYVSMGDVLDIGTSDFSFSLWARTSAGTDVYMNPLAKVGSSNPDVGYRLQFTNGDDLCTTVGNGSASVTACITNETAVLRNGQWHHYAVTIDRDGMLSLFINGVPRAATSIAAFNGNNLNTTQSFTVGAYNSGNPQRIFNGDLDHVKVYTRVLTPGEVTDLYNEGSGGGGGSGPDSTAPAAIASPTITNVQTDRVTLNWTAPGDDGSTGTAASYDIRYRAGSSFSESNWDSATTVAGEPAPLIAGANQSMTITGLTPGTQYTFAIKTSDEVPNISTISTGNPTATTQTVDTTPPAAIASPTITNVQSDRVTLNWTAPGDNGTSGTAASYDIRYRAGSSFAEADWTSATSVVGEPSPQVAGTNQSMVITGLSPSTQYTFAIKTSDEVPNISSISTGNPTATTLALTDSTAPAAIASPTITNVQTDRVTLNWTAPGDDDNTGTAASYDIRYRAGSSFSESNWASATVVAGEPAPQVAGTAQSMTITGLTPGTQYTFAIKTSDEVPNISVISTGNPTATTQSGGTGPSDYVAYWPFDTNANDTSSNANHGTFTNGAAISSIRKVGAGALTVDGSNDFVDIGNPTSLRLTGSMTLAFWIRGDQFPSNDHDVISKSGAAGSRGYLVRIDGAEVAGPTGQVECQVSGTGSDATTVTRNSSEALNVDTWYHVACVYNASTQTMNMYVNGTLDNNALEGTVPSSQFNTSLNVNIGRRPTNEAQFDGLIDEVYVYNRALSGAEVASLHSQGAGDVSAPSVPSGLAATAQSNSQINLLWNASTDTGGSGLAGYRVERCEGNTCTNFVQVAAPAATSHNDTGLAPATTYRYRVRAEDAAGNLSVYSSIVNGTTNSGAGGIPTDFVAYWNFNTNGNDSSPNANHATLQNGAAITTTQKISGVGSVNFDGTDDRADAGSNASIDNIYASGGTVSVWIRPENISGTGWRTYLSKDLDISSSGGKVVLWGDWSGGSGAQWETASVLSVNTWHHILVTYDGSSAGNTPSVYVNSIPRGVTQTVAPSGTFGDASVPLVFGDSYTFGDEDFDGQVDEVRIYKRILAYDEIADLYEQGGGTAPPQDTTPPSVPTGLVATPVSSSQITVSWNPSSDTGSGVYNYEVGRCAGAGCISNFTVIASPTATTYPNTGLLSGQTFGYRVRTRDNAGNFSAWTSVVYATTQAGSGPTITGSGPSGVVSGSSQEIFVNTAAASTCRYDIVNVGYDAMSFTFLGTGTTHTRQIAGLGTGTQTFYAACRDGVGDAAVTIQFVII